MNDRADAEQFRTIRKTLGAGDYQVGFGNEFETEAAADALPKGQNSPQRILFGLDSELVSGASFTAPRPEPAQLLRARAVSGVLSDQAALSEAAGKAYDAMREAGLTSMWPPSALAAARPGPWRRSRSARRCVTLTGRPVG